MKLTTLKMAVLGALMLPTMSVIAEEAATAAVEAPKSDFSVSGNVGLFSDYIFRGYTQTKHHCRQPLMLSPEWNTQNGYFLTFRMHEILI